LSPRTAKKKKKETKRVKKEGRKKGRKEGKPSSLTEKESSVLLHLKTKSPALL
jgi:hypothetical protein